MRNNSQWGLVKDEFHMISMRFCRQDQDFRIQNPLRIVAGVFWIYHLDYNEVLFYVVSQHLEKLDENG